MTILEMALATARLTRLATTDEIIAGPRASLSRAHPALDYLLHCHWCSGAWLAGGVVLASRLGPARPVIRALAVAQAASMMAQAVDTAEVMG